MKLPINNQRGAYTVFFVLILPILFGFMGLGIDVSHYYVQRTKLQNTADAAALAGVRELPDYPAAKAKATSYIAVNDASNPLASFERLKGDTQLSVALSKEIDTVFSRLVGVETLTIEVKAVAEKPAGGFDLPFDYAIFSAGKNIDLTVNNLSGKITGSIYSNNNIKIGNGATGFEITGTLQAAGSVTVPDQSYKIAAHNPSTLALPNLTSKVMEQFTAPSQTPGDVRYGPAGSGPDHKTPIPDIYASGDILATGNDFKIVGNIIMADGNIDLKGNTTLSTPTGSLVIYSKNGDIKFSSGLFELDSNIPIYIYAEKGDIDFRGGSYHFDQKQPVFIYAKEGDITFGGLESTFVGALYAPRGMITLRGGNFDITGSLVAREFTPFGGVKLTLTNASQIGGSSGKLRLVE